ncbi:MAG: transglycosylase domain-containing protein [Thermodesulfobacteriota bacterium]
MAQKRPIRWLVYFWSPILLFLLLYSLLMADISKRKKENPEWRMEKVLSKKRILELYLNVVEWGEGIFGIEAASRHYYGESSSQLTPMEATRLAAILPSPRRYSPLGEQRYVGNRANNIDNIMIQRGIILPEYEEEADQSEPPPSEETDSS